MYMVARIMHTFYQYLHTHTHTQDAAYLTEVHHVNGSGEDAGVVYCEMQARENTPESLSIFHLFQDFYPGRCGYKVGGVWADSVYGDICVCAHCSQRPGG